MISVEEAKRIMMEHVPALGSETIGIHASHGRYLAEDIPSPHDHPLFDCSAVDGYAIRGEVSEWSILGEVVAGGVLQRTMRPGECVRIFTGGSIPRGADSVVMQEHCRTEGGRMKLSAGLPRKGANIRRRAEHVRIGDYLARSGSTIRPISIGLFASVGVVDLPVIKRPSVQVIVTGGEFMMDIGQELVDGKIFSSNDDMLGASLAEEGIKVIPAHIEDHHSSLASAIGHFLKENDVVITTGGVSIGDYDLIRPVLESMGAVIHFHNVAQKPGKPMLFATLNGKPVFGLPGNPRAVMVLFWEYALPFLRSMQGAKDPWLPTDHLPITHPLEVKGDRAEFRASQVRGGKVTLLRDEGSHMLRSLVDADALAYIPADRRSWAEGDPIEVHFLPR